MVGLIAIGTRATEPRVVVVTLPKLKLQAIVVRSCTALLPAYIMFTQINCPAPIVPGNIGLRVPAFPLILAGVGATVVVDDSSMGVVDDNDGSNPRTCQRRSGNAQNRPPCLLVLDPTDKSWFSPPPTPPPPPPQKA